MNRGLKARFFLVFIVMFSFLGIARAGVWYEIFDLSTGKKITSSTIRLSMTRNQLSVFKITAFYIRKNDNPSIARLQVYTGKPNYNLPSYVENWNDQIDTLYEHSSQLENTFFIRPIAPESVGLDSFRVEATLRYGLSPWDGMNAVWLTVYVNVGEPAYPAPAILSEPAFTAGTSNTLYWIPTRGAAVQDLYHFDDADPGNLMKAIQRLYKRNGQDTLSTVIEGLEEGHSYGYFVKTVFGSGDRAVTLYSDITHSIQDRTPPDAVTSVQAILAGTRTVLVSWVTVADAISGMDSYRIYRSESTGSEILIDTIPAGTPSPSTLTYEDRIQSGVTVYYRVRAVDKVGNEGDGERTNSVISGSDASDQVSGNGGKETNGDQTPEPDRPFKKGHLDTLRIMLTGLEKQLRFQAVRDSGAYFNNPPDLGARVFDSGWLPMNQVQRNPANYDEAVQPFDYTSGGQFPEQFVNGHTYIRRVIREYLATHDTLNLGETIPDCFPPDDIRNLKIDAAVENPNASNPSAGFSKWHLQLDWEAARDGVSGLKRHRLFRKVDGLDSSFQEVPLPDRFTGTAFVDRLSWLPTGIVQNASVRYRVTSEDFVGNIRGLSETVWEAGDRALTGPLLGFTDTTSPDAYPVGSDTLFTRSSIVVLRLERFDTGPVLRYFVSINGRESVHRSLGADTLQIRLPADETSVIKVRAIYTANRSSIWSNAKTVIRASSHPVWGVTAWTDTAYWAGNIHLRWARPSLDVLKYEVVRWSDAQAPAVVGLVSSLNDSVLWTDFYDRNELLHAPGDTLETYRVYHYSIRKINLFGDVTPPSDSVFAYCNRPPRIVSHKIQTENGRLVAKIRWTRPVPSTFPFDFTTIVKIYSDSTRRIVEVDTVADDDTEYTYRSVQPGHNAIFQILEILNHDPLNRRSAWSQPYTVSFKKLEMAVLAQPKGKIAVHWDTSIVDSLLVGRFLLMRSAGGDTFSTYLENRQSSYMDGPAGLLHGHSYSYAVYALDSLDQVVAANMETESCDSGSAYIPDIVPFAYGYFNDDSIDVSWVWKGIDGKDIQESTRGASCLILQASVSQFFAPDTAQTRSLGCFDADPLKRTKRIRIPSLGNRENEKLYFRITARDSWGNPIEELWSSDFYPVRIVVFDPVSPRAMNKILFTATEAYYAQSDSVVHRMQWTGDGVERPLEPGTEDWDRLVGNVAAYQVWRSADSGPEVLVSETPTRPDGGAYSAADTVLNLSYRYRVVTLDSAGNGTAGGWNAVPLQVPTPDVPVPTQKRGCRIQPLSSGDSTEYFVEIAMKRAHFRLAYEMDRNTVRDSLICRSGWTMDTTYACQTGWGSINTDTTWFRVKARRRSGNWTAESGWSAIVPYIPSAESNPEKPDAAEAGIPRDFGIGQNYPNPFNAGTTIPYQLAEPAKVTLSVYNIRRALTVTLVNAVQQAGHRTAAWDGSDKNGRQAASGIYIGLLSMRSETSGKTVLKRIKLVMIR
jgi:hypothetical protein